MCAAPCHFYSHNRLLDRQLPASAPFTFQGKKKVWLFPAIALNSRFLPRVTVCLPCFQGTLFCLFLMAQIIKKKKISRQRTVPSVFCLGVRRHCLEKGTDHMLKGEDINHLLRTSKMKCEGKHEIGKRSF